jgi:glycosyltransferase involved in cell wall biosynthesis
MKEKISVIIPLYNKEQEIKRCLDSVLCQTFQDFEVIVVDDHSSDGSLGIVKSYSDPRITVIEQDHHGVAYTRNHGVDLAIGEYLAFIDADDEWMPKHLETIVRLIGDFPEAGLFTTACNIRMADGKTRSPEYMCIPPPPWEGLIPDFFQSLARGIEKSFANWPTNSSVVVIPKNIFFERGRFLEGYWMSEDSALYINIALKYPVAFSWELGATIYFDASNRANDKNQTPDYENPSVKTVRAAFLKDEVPAEFKGSLNEYITKMEILRAIQYIRIGDSSSARNILKKCKTKWQIMDKTKWLLIAKIPYPLFLYAQKIRQKLKTPKKSDNISK